MHEADGAYSIWSTWSCYWLDQFLTLALIIWIFFEIFIILLDLSNIFFLISEGVELSLCIVVTLSENVTTCFQDSS